MAIQTMPGSGFTIAGSGHPLREYPGLPYPFTGFLMGFDAANTIKGTLFYDANNNGLKDVGEVNFNEATIVAKKQQDSLSATPYNGGFQISADTGTYISHVQLNSPYYFTDPSTHTSTFSSYYNVDSFGFAVQSIPNKKDLSVNLIPIDRARPGFNVSYLLVYKNRGTVNMSSITVQLVKDSRLSFVSASQTPSSINGNTLTWNISNFNTLDSASILINCTVAAPPTVNNGDSLLLTTSITPVVGDETPLDNTASLEQRVVGSYDPNDKTEANNGTITSAQVNSGEHLNYLIRFQNTGTDTAFNVTIRDTLESRLDWSTLQMVAASHLYQLSIESGNKLTWQFNGIKLPYSGIDEPKSHGYIAYRIKPVSTVVIGDVINNAAGIYFDFNLPVATNTQQTLVMSLAPLPLTLLSFHASLNGSTVNVSWKSTREYNASHFEVQRSTYGIDFTTIGIVQAGGTNYLFKDNEPLNGYNYYRLKPVDTDGSFTYSTIVLVNVKDAATIISSLYPNPGNGNVTLKLKGAVQGNVLVQVLDQQGRELVTRQFGVQHAGEFKTPLNLGKLSKGVYVLRILVDDKIYLQKILIQ